MIGAGRVGVTELVAGTLVPPVAASIVLVGVESASWTSLLVCAVLPGEAKLPVGAGGQRVGLPVTVGGSGAGLLGRAAVLDGRLGVQGVAGIPVLRVSEVVLPLVGGWGRVGRQEHHLWRPGKALLLCQLSPLSWRAPWQMWGREGSQACFSW